MGEEEVALYDERGRPRGAAPRSRMRAENLVHAATGVVVRDRLGRVLVHRRTDTKDVYPGRWDLAAGGVLGVGEEPEAGARRELAEEVGVTGVDLVPEGTAYYGDDRTRYWAHLYSCVWDGPVRGQPEEVAELAWWPLEVLAERLDDPAWAWMPDSRALLGDWVRARAADRTPVDEEGWDSRAEIAEGRWLDRRPRRPEVAARLLAETRLLPRLAPRLALAVPVPEVMVADPLWVRHALVPGTASEPGQLTATDGEAVGAFLRTLHDLPASVWAGTGVPTAEAARQDLLAVLERMRRRVLPLLPVDRRAAGARLLDASAERQPATLIHGDLGPAHLLVTAGRVTGVIDWSDAAEGDPAVDLAWVLHGAPPAFAAGVAAAYGPTAGERERARRRHRLGPWFEILWGLEDGGPAYVASGLDGVLARLGP